MPRGGGLLSAILLSMFVSNGLMTSYHIRALLGYIAWLAWGIRVPAILGGFLPFWDHWLRACANPLALLLREENLLTTLYINFGYRPLVGSTLRQLRICMHRSTCGNLVAMSLNSHLKSAKIAFRSGVSLIQPCLQLFIAALIAVKRPFPPGIPIDGCCKVPAIFESHLAEFSFSSRSCAALLGFFNLLFG